MIDICWRLLVKCPPPFSADRVTFAYFKYFSCPVEEELFLLRNDIRRGGMGLSMVR
jgi:hypothetical protein